MHSLNSISERARHSSSVAALREPAFRVINRMEDLAPDVQVNALFLAAVVVAEALGLDIHEEVARAGRKVAAAEGPFTAHVQALRDYAKGELLRT
jgi:hypothetical protein